MVESNKIFNEIKKEFNIGVHTNCNEVVGELIDLFNNNKNKKIEVLIQGLNTAISKVVLVSEVVKSRVKGIHQNLELGCFDSTNIDIDKIIPKIEIYLSNFEPENKSIGYQAPYDMKKLYQLNTLTIKENFIDISDKENKDN